MLPSLICGRERFLCLLFIIIQFILISSYSHAQKPEHMHEGVFRIRVSEGMARQLEKSSLKKNAANVVATGIESLDVLNKRFNVTGMKRVFPDAGKYEAKHRKYGLHHWYEVQIDKNTPIYKAIPGFKSLKECEVAEPIYKKAVVGSSNSNFGPRIIKPNSTTTLPGTSNDPMLGNQWHYNNTGQTGGTPGADIKLLNAWAVETGSPNVIVAIEDGGIDLNHEDLTANLWVNSDEVPGNGIDDDNNGYVDDYHGYSFVDHTGNIQAHDHGTHVAGTVAAVNNNGIGVAGVAGGSGTGDGVRLMSCAVFSNWGGADGFAQAYIYSADNGAVISQNSWTYTAPGYYEQAVLDGIDYFTAEAGKDEFGNQVGPMNGGIVIFAAANYSSNSNYYPASYGQVLSVASTNHQDAKSWYSNFGSWVDISAPGGETNITEQGVLSTLPSNQYGYYQGTSMACPHVSGVAGLVVSKLGGLGFSTQALRERLIQTADNIDGSNPAYIGMLGSGRVNAFAALGQNDNTPPDPITDLVLLNKDITTITLGWTAPSDGGSGSASYYDLRYSNQPIDSNNFDLASQVTMPAQTAGSSESYMVAGLNAGTTYYFAIRSFDYFGNRSSISNVLAETTAFPPVISVSPQEFSADLITAAFTTVPLTIANNGAGILQFSIPDTNAAGHVIPWTTEGTLEPGQNAVIDVRLTAAYLLEGTYQYQLQVNSNDPVTPTVTIPVTINVTNNGFPIAYVTHDMLSFGKVALSKSKKLGFIIANEGSEPLNVTGILSGSASFTTDLPEGLVIAPMENALINVNCTPDATGILEGTLTLQMNDPVQSEYIVSLTGEGVEGPSIVPNVSDLSFVLYKNHQETKWVQIANQGGSNLLFRVKEEAVLDSALTNLALVENTTTYTRADSSGAKQMSSNIFAATTQPFIENTSLSTQKIKVLILTPDPNAGDLSYWLSQYSDLEISMIGGDLSWINIHLLLYYDVVITTNNFEWSNVNLDPETVGNLLADYVDVGGKVIVNQLAYSPYPGYKMQGRFISENYGPFTQASSAVSNFVNLGTIAQPGHPILQGVNYLQYNGSISQVNLIDESTRLADWDNGEVFLAINENVLGVNLLPSSGYGGYADWSGDLPHLFHNALVYMADIKPSYLKINSTAGEIYPNSAMAFAVKFDSKGMETGEYHTVIKIYSNSVADPVVSIPVSLTVLGEQFSHTPDIITSTLVRGETSTHSIIVTNLGAETRHYEVDVEPNGIQSGMAVTKNQGFDVLRNQAGPVNIPPLIAFPEKRIANQSINPKDLAISLSTTVPSVSNTVYATDFEDFALGDLYQNGWYNSGRWAISDSNPFAGVNHMHHDPEVKSTFSYALAPILANGESAFVTFSMKLKVEGNNGEFGIHPSSFNNDNNLSPLFFNGSDIFTLVRGDNPDQYWYENIPVQRPAGYFDLTVQYNKITGDFTIYFDSLPVFKGRGFPSTIVSVAFTQWLPENGDMTVDIDDFQIIDGKKYDNTPSYITVSPIEGLISPGESIELTVILNADSIQSGIFASDIKFLADQDAIVVPVILEVLAAGPEIEVNPTAFDVTVDYKKQSNENLSISNPGAQYLNFSLYLEDANAPAQVTLKNPVSKFSPTDSRVVAKLDDDQKLSKSIQGIKPGSISIMNGVYLLDEHFESGVPPSGWSVVNSAGNGPQWNTASSFGEGNYSYYGEAATVSSDAFGSSPLGTALISPVMNKSGYNNIVLQYYANYQNYGNRDFFDLDISVNGGEWLNILRWNEDHGSFRGYGEYVSLWLDGYLTNASTFQLRWQYYDTNPGAWDWYAQIDNVSVTGQSIPWLTLSQSWGYVAPGSEVSINAFFDGSQLEKGQLYKNIKVYSNSVNNSDLDVPVAFKINGPAIMAIEPDTVKAKLYRGTSSQIPVMIKNEGEGNLNFSFLGFNSATMLQNDVSRIYPDNYVVDKNVKDTRVGHPVLVGQGGPDAGGYSWKDSNENGGPLFNWQEIRNTGTYVSLSDDNSVTVPMPFAFKFYDNIYNEITIGSNGYLTFGSIGWSLGNTELPSAGEPNNVIAAFWDDLYPPMGSVHYQTFADRFIIQYTNVPYWYNSSLPNTFQIILYLNGDIALQYLDMNNTSSATTGLENSNGTVGLQVAFNTNYIHNNLAIVFSNYTAPAWIKPEPAYGSVDGGSSSIIDLLFITETLEPGDYETELSISSNDYFNPSRTLPVVLSIFDNYAPVIDSLPNVRVIETQTSNLVITAHDEDDPSVSVTLLNPPSFFTLTSNADGSATYSIHPSLGLAGQYDLTIQAVDLRGLVSTQNFTLTVVPYGVENFSLIDKRSGQVITTFESNITLNKADVNYPYYQIRANTNPATVGSVQFFINGAKKKGSTAPPYLLTDTELKSIKVGNHVLKATAYTQKSNKGQVGRSAEAVLTIINQKIQSTTTVVAASVLIVPNPVEDEMKVEVTSELRGKSELLILDGTGLPVYRATVTSDELKNYKLSMKAFPSGIYYLQLTDEEGRRVTTRIVKK